MRAQRRHTGVFYRAARVATRSIDLEKRTMNVTFSTEFAVERFFGREILDHSADAVRMKWLKSGRAPFIIDHSVRDRVGVVEQARIDTSAREGRARIRFGQSARASEVLRDYADGIRSSVSVGYLIHEAVLEDRGEGGETWRIRDWEPLEISDVAIPADPNAHAREGGRQVETLFRRPGDQGGEGCMWVRDRETRQMIEIEEDEFNEELHERTRRSERRAAGAGEHDLERARREGRQAVDAIYKLGERWNQRAKAAEFVRDGKSLAEFREWLVNVGIPPTKPLHTPDVRSYDRSTTGDGNSLGLSAREIQGYSLHRAIRAFVEKNWSGAELERECSEAVLRTLGARSPRGGFFVPPDVLRAPMRRDLTKGGSGGNLVGTELDDSSFIDRLRNRAQVVALGATVLPGLVRDIDIPRRTGSATAQWLAEGGNVTASDSTYDNVSLTPKTLAARSNLSRKMLLQSTPEAEDLTMSDLAAVLGIEMDRAAIAGSGSGAEPLGILGTGGVGIVPIGTDGGAPTWDHVVGLETELGIDNADMGAIGYLRTPACAASCDAHRCSRARMANRSGSRARAASAASRATARPSATTCRAT